MQRKAAIQTKTTPPILICGGLILACFIALSASSAKTKEPWEDESWFGAVTYNLASKGSLSTDILEGQGTFREGMAHHFYWEPPLSFVTNAAAVELFGFSLFTIRSVSTAFGMAAVLCAFLLARKLTGSEGTGLLAMALVASDYFFVIGSSDGRMDAMCMALGFAGVTTYFLLREKHLLAAIVLSQIFIAASGLTHPNGMIWFLGLWLLILRFDRGRLRLGMLAAAALPYLVAAAGWGAFIARDPHDFLVQFLGNIRESGSSNGSLQHPLMHPLQAIVSELTERYIYPFGLGTGIPPMNRTKAVILLIYTGSLIAAGLSRQIRRSLAGQAVLCLIAVSFLMLTYMDGNKMSYYLIHITPLLAILTAMVLWSALSRGGRMRWPAVFIAGALIVVQAAGILYRVRQATYAHQYLPAVAAIRSNSNPGDLVIGSAAFFWTLRGERHLKDDFRLGYYTHAHPQLIVIGPFYRTLDRHAGVDLQTYLRNTLASYHTVPFRGEYEILAPN